jgi:DNA-binding PadR family transcriptional regulator
MYDIYLDISRYIEKEVIMFEGLFFESRKARRELKRGSSFQKGDLKYILLVLIKNHPRHGYDIIRELEEQSFGFYKPSPGVIYPTLQMLEEMGYIEASDQEGKKVYSITGRGLEFLSQKKDIANNVRREIKNRWDFKKIGRMAVLMKRYHSLENLVGKNLRHMDEDKAERINQILSKAYQDITSIINE